MKAKKLAIIIYTFNMLYYKSENKKKKKSVKAYKLL